MSTYIIYNSKLVTTDSVKLEMYAHDYILLCIQYTRICIIEVIIVFGMQIYRLWEVSLGFTH